MLRTITLLIAVHHSGDFLEKNADARLKLGEARKREQIKCGFKQEGRHEERNVSAGEAQPRPPEAALKSSFILQLLSDSSYSWDQIH
jgi:hypothetical protein